MDKRPDKRKVYGIMLDTETCNSMDDPLCYDISWEVIDSKGNKYEERSFAVKEVFCGMNELMANCYYANKLPAYHEEIARGEKQLARLWFIREQLRKDCDEYACKFICAHNARFDYKSLHTTQRYLTKSAYRWFCPYGLVWWDTMKMAESVILPMKRYRAFCEKNGYKCKNGQLRKTAEILYRFISHDNEFVEEHKALADVDIEREILAYCVRQHKKMRKELWNNKKNS